MKKTTMYECIEKLRTRITEYELQVGCHMFFHDLILLVPRDNLRALAKLKKQFPALTIWRPDMMWSGSGWRMRWGNVRLLLHMLWCWFWDDGVHFWAFNRWWLYRTSKNGNYHATWWLYDDTQRICGVHCSCGKVFAQRKPIWLYPRKKVRA